jgi:hypothetical protein
MGGLTILGECLPFFVVKYMAKTLTHSYYEVKSPGGKTKLMMKGWEMDSNTLFLVSTLSEKRQKVARLKTELMDAEWEMKKLEGEEKIEGDDNE